MNSLWRKVVLAVGLIGLAMLFLEPVEGKSKQSPGMQTTRTIALAMFAYSVENGGKYPEGKSSTEVFQKLVDGKFISDPSFFYLPFAGKTKWISGKLKPENVCFDVTCCLDAKDSEFVPVVFFTGCRIQYAPDGGAMPLITYDLANRTWGQWWNEDAKRPWAPFIVVAYKNNGVRICLPPSTPLADNLIPKVVPSEFDTKGKAYVQLTPDGPISQPSGK